MLERGTRVVEGVGERDQGYGLQGKPIQKLGGGRGLAFRRYRVRFRVYRVNHIN